MSVATIHMVRHGEVHNPGQVLYGRLPGFHLSSLGYQMADAIADWFVDRATERGEAPKILVSSPLLRAQETIQPMAEALGLPVRIERRVIEAGNKFEGRSDMSSQLKKPWNWPLVLNPFRPSWGEPYRAQVQRVSSAMFDLRDELLARHGGGEAVVVSHQLPIWVTRLSAERARLWHDPRERECSLTSVTTFHFDPGYHLPRIEYREPNAELTGSAAALPGA